MASEHRKPKPIFSLPWKLQILPSVEDERLLGYSAM
jgi:hypothetical protein